MLDRRAERCARVDRWTFEAERPARSDRRDSGKQTRRQVKNPQAVLAFVEGADVVLRCRGRCPSANKPQQERCDDKANARADLLLPTRELPELLEHQVDGYVLEAVHDYSHDDACQGVRRKAKDAVAQACRSRSRCSSSVAAETAVIAKAAAPSMIALSATSLMACAANSGW